jgi:hypothetical protein
MAFPLPDNSPIVEGDKVGFAWLQWFSQINATISANRQSGTTAQRPTRLLWIGRRYFDLDLGVDGIGMAVYVASVSPAVWVDGAGNTV